MEEMVFKLGIEGLIGSVIGKPILTIRQENMGQARHMELIFIESIIYLNIYCLEIKSIILFQSNKDGNT